MCRSERPLGVRQLAAAFIARSLLRAHSLGAASCAEPKRKQACALQIRNRIYGIVHLAPNAGKDSGRRS